MRAKFSISRVISQRHFTRFGKRIPSMILAG
jgi:hypothetical protein